MTPKLFRAWSVRLAATLLAGAVAVSAAAQAPTTAATERVTLTVGKSTVLSTTFDIVRIALTNPAIADAVVVQPRAILIDGKTPGTISLIVWGESQNQQFDVVVEPRTSGLQERLRELFPNEPITVTENNEALILSGNVSSNDIALRVAEIAAATSSKSKVVNLMTLPGGTPSQQVMLQVRFAEVSRRAITELGANFFTGPNGYKDWLGRSTTQQFSAPNYVNRLGPPPASNPTDEGRLTFSDFLNLFVFNTEYDMGAVIRALQGKGLFQSLAEPNLIAYNNQEASFLAGGEIPVPVVQGLSNAVTIQWKEFGVRLHFKPTIAGDTIRLKVTPEVSSLDFSNGIVLSGFRIPAIATRRAETDVELKDGQSFAIAGLIDNSVQDDVNMIPVLGHIPIIGYLFKSKAERKERTELLVLITPKLVRPLNPDEVPALPVNPGKFLPSTGVGTMLKGGGGLADAPSRGGKK